MRRPLLALALAACACGSAEAGPLCSPACGPSQVCASPDGCTGYPCAPECRTPCATDADCVLGHACTSRLLCADACATCPLGLACSSDRGACVGVGCTSDADCDAQSFCDPTSRACYPMSGSCATEPCRPLSEGASLFCARSCDEGFCRLNAIPPEPALGAPPDRTLDPYFSAADSAFASADAVVFEWRPVASEAFLFVTRSPPTTLAQLSATAIWADALPAGASRARWADGASVRGGVWSASPGEPPAGVALYVTMVSIDGLSAAGISSPVPFIVGAWRADGDACAADADCLHPRLARTCAALRCARLCESHADCVAPRLCGHPAGELGLRACGAP